MRGKKGLWPPKKELKGTIHVFSKKQQAVCVDMKLIGTTEGISQNSANLVLLHEYGRFWGAHIMGI
jgi:hypothetical protein